MYAATGHLLFIREGKLLAQGFDPDRLELRGDPFPIAEHVPEGNDTVRVRRWTDRLSHAVSGQRPATARVARSVRSGNRKGGVSRYVGVRSVAFARWPACRRVPVRERQYGHLVVRNRPSHVGPGDAGLGRRYLPALVSRWHPHGVRLEPERRPNESLPDESSALHRAVRNCCSRRHSPSFQWTGPPTGASCCMRVSIRCGALTSGRCRSRETEPPFAVVQTDFSDRLPQFSPDGKWIAYQSDKTGRFEIYVQPFPGPGPDARVSIDGGAQVRWNPNGKELFYIAADDRLMAVPIGFASNGRDRRGGTPVGLFATNVGSAATDAEPATIRGCSGRPVVRDELRSRRSQTSPITVILNWKPTQSQ